MKIDRFNDDWKYWIWHNVHEGCSKQRIFKILLKNNFDYEAIKNEMSYEPEDPDIALNNSVKIASESGPAIDPIRKPVWDLHIPNAVKYDTNKMQLFTLDKFLNKKECKIIKRIAKSRLNKSTIATKGEPDKEYRTSYTCFLSQLDNKSEDIFIREIDNRICRMLGINPSHSEEMQVQNYQVGQQYKVHVDYFDPNRKEYEEYTSEQGNRTWTFMVYLNEVEEGGATYMPRINERFKPKQGQALIWNSINEDGTVNDDTLHAGEPPVKGEKTIITKWFKQKGSGSYIKRTSGDILPNYSTNGFKKRRIPKELYKKIMLWYKAHQNQFKKNEIYIPCLKNKDSKKTGIANLTEDIKKEIDKVLKPILQEWSGKVLEQTAIYGIRSYLNGTSLDVHTDKEQTHVISAILHIEDDSDEPWPLHIKDNYYRQHKIYFEPGDMVLYESARCEHGRPTKFKGKYYRNLYVHYRPTNWLDTLEKVQKRFS